MEPSKKYALNAHDMTQVAQGYAALIGAITLVFLLAIITQIDIGPYNELLVLIITPLIHTAIKWIKDNDTGLPTKDMIDALPGNTK